MKAERDPESGEGESSRKRRRWTGSLKAPSRRAGPPGPPGKRVSFKNSLFEISTNYPFCV